MRRRIRRPSHATVVAYVALFFAVGGAGAYAANEWTGANIVDETLTGGDIRGFSGTATTAGVNGSVTTADIHGQPQIASSGQPYVNGSLTTWDLADGRTLGRDIEDGSLTGADVGDDSLTGTDVYEPSLSTVPSAANSERLGGLSPASFMRSPTKWKKLVTVGERLPVEIGNPACSGSRDCTATLRCDPGDVLLSGGFNQIDNGTRLMAGFPFNANGYDHKYVLHWHNNSTADTVELNIICADQ
jgi:hypothetical protein